MHVCMQMWVHACACVCVNESVHSMSVHACTQVCVIVREAGRWVWGLEDGSGLR